MKQILLSLALAVALLPACKKDTVEKDQNFKRSVETFQGKNLEVGHRKGNSPSVVLIAGFDTDMEAWEKVYNGLDKNITVFTYNRPGIGRSENVSGMRDAQTIAKEIKAVLDANGVKPPYIFVAHSMGGIYARMFYHQYPTLLKGIVLVDATHEGQIDALLAPYPEEVRAMYREQLKAENEADLAKMPEGSTKEEFRSNFELNYNQIKSFPAITQIPLYVLTSIKVPAGVDPIIAEVTAALHQQWAVQAGSKGKFVATDKSGHFIQMEEPQLVLQGIKWVMQ